MSIVQTESTTVTVNLSEEDRALLRETVEYKWPGTDMSDAEALLSLARIAGNCLLKKKKSRSQ